MSRELLARHAERSAGDLSRVGKALVDELPLELAGDDLRPGPPELPPPGVSLAGRPAIHLGQQRPFGQPLVAVHPFQRIATQHKVQGRTENLSELQVDAPNGPVEIDLGIKVEAGIQKHVQRFGRMGVKRQASFGDKGVVDDPLHVDRPDGNPAYIRVARDVIHVVGRIGADHGGLQSSQPVWSVETLQLGRRYEIRDPAGIDALPRLEVGAGRSAKCADERSQWTCYQRAADHLVIDSPRVEVIFVEEVPERTMPHVMEQPCDAHGLLDQPNRRRVLAAGAESRVQVMRPLAGQVHRAKRVLEARVFRGRKDPPRALQLVNATKSLQPRSVQEVLLGSVARHPARPALRDAKVSIDGVA